MPCPSGSAGCTNGFCWGLGHLTCKGGSLPLNAFGADMKKYGYTWTKQFCEADSDGDGLTNGEELGDPCCVWGAWDAPSDYSVNFTPSHPGDPSSKVINYQRPSCDITTSKVKAPTLGQFNPGEVQKVAKVYIENYTIPMPGNMGKQTTYVDIAWNFPDDSADLFHVVSADAIVNTKNLHHYVVRGCPFKWPASQHGKPPPKSESAKCKTPFGGYVPGRGITALPPWAGRPIGKAAGIQAFVVNVHFDNPKLEKGVVSRDGMVIHYTPTLRNKTMSQFNIMQVSQNPTMYIPPKKHRYFMTRECNLTVSDTTATVINGEQRLMSIAFHAHLLGSEMYADRVRGNDRLSLAAETPWHFDDQYDHIIFAKNYTVKTGDMIQTTCIFDSTNRANPTKVALETIDEMCWAGFTMANGGLRGKCVGQIWTGELSDKESGVGLELRHPVKTADGVWTGRDLRSGGTLVRSSISLDNICEDNKMLKSRNLCTTIAGVVPKASASCSKQFGQLGTEMGNKMLASGALAKLMPLHVCCTSFCKEVCPGVNACQPPKPSSTTTSTMPTTCSANCEKCTSATLCTKCRGDLDPVKGSCEKVKAEMKVVTGSFSIKMPSTNASAFTSNPKVKEVFQKALASTIGVDAVAVIIKDIYVDGVTIGGRSLQAVALPRRLAVSNVKVEYEVRTAKVIDSTSMDSTAMAKLKMNVEKQAAEIGAPIGITELPTASTPKTSPVKPGPLSASTASVLGFSFLVALFLFLHSGIV